MNQPIQPAAAAASSAQATPLDKLLMCVAAVPAADRKRICSKLEADAQAQLVEAFNTGGREAFMRQVAPLLKPAKAVRK